MKEMLMQQYIVFKLDEQFYGTNIENVEIIEKIRPIMRVPKAPRCVKGVINLRGEIIPVISLRKQFNLEDKPYGDKTRIIIIKIEDGMVGLIVDEVKEVIEIKESEIEVVQNIQGKMKSNDILGVGKVQDHIITLLHLPNIIDEAFTKQEYN